MALYRMDQQINDRGILVDRQLVAAAVECDLQYKDTVTARAYELTGLANPNSPAQIMGWLTDHGVEVDSLDKKAVKGMIGNADGEVLEVLQLRLLMAKTSVKKYEAIERSVCSDGRVHGLLQFYGANRTGRWAGRLVQVQNLPQNHIEDLELARTLVRDRRFIDMDLLYDSTPGVLSELIRTAFVPKPGCRFIVADFSAIEARVLAWFSGEQWRLDTFAEVVTFTVLLLHRCSVFP
jgi:DNA polymerase